MSVPATRDCWFLSGPTASGKTAVGIELARRLGGELLSLDSMAVYRGLDIGTAKPSPAERAAVRHHLIDLIEPQMDFSVAQYVAAAESAANDVTAGAACRFSSVARRCISRRLLRGIFAGPPADWDFRRECNELVQAEGATALHARLVTVDPLSAQRLHVEDTRRVTRRSKSGPRPDSH